ncbi:MAG: Spx/MgsR family RNA polymerase-binding regulatory protein [Pseudomonadota bacterium]
MELYGLKNCDKCRAAMKALDNAGIAYVFHDIREASLSTDDLSRWIDATGLDAIANKRSTTWRALPDAQKALLEKDAASLLLSHRTLIKRPVIVLGKDVSVGWTDKIAQKVIK